MSIEQTIDIPESRILTIEVPPEVPPGRTILAFIPAPAQREQPCTSISRHFGGLKNSKAFAGDPVAIQRQMRAEWND